MHFMFNIIFGNCARANNQQVIDEADIFDDIDRIKRGLLSMKIEMLKTLPLHTKPYEAAYTRLEFELFILFHFFFYCHSFGFYESASCVIIIINFYHLILMTNGKRIIRRNQINYLYEKEHCMRVYIKNRICWIWRRRKWTKRLV